MKTVKNRDLTPYPLFSVPQLKMMIVEIETIIGRQISIEEWNRL